MIEMEANQRAWATLAQDHYQHFRERLKEPDFLLNPLVREGLGDIKEKKVLHLQCNTGADSILLARLGGDVTGVDFVPENIHYAKLLAEEFPVESLRFIHANVLDLPNIHTEKYDVVLTTDGVIGWIPDRKRWAKVIACFLKDDGRFFLHDAHPFYIAMDPEALKKQQVRIQYPYFSQKADREETIGGYAGPERQAENYYWSYTFGELITALSSAGLMVEWLQEYDLCAPGMGGQESVSDGLYGYPAYRNMFPLTFSLSARKEKQ